MIAKSVNRYLEYAKGIKGKFNVNGFPVNLNSDFDFSNILHSLNTLSLIIETLPNDNTIQIYSLQNIEDNYIPREYWSNELWNLMRKKESKTIYIFLFDTSSDSLEKSYKKYNNWGSTDTNFCHSMMMRDIIYKKRKGFDFDLALGYSAKEQSSEFLKEFNRKISKIDLDGSLSLNESFFEKIVIAFNTYFHKDIFNIKTYHKLITDFYSYGLNKQSFGNLKDDNPIVDSIRISDISTGHELYGSVIKEMKKSPPIKNISKLSKWLIYLNILSDLTKLFVHNCALQGEIKILLIDDKPENISDEIELIKDISDRNIVVENDSENNILTHDKFDKLFNALESNDKKVSKDIKEVYDKIINGDYDFIIIDLDYYGELKGFEYLRKLRKAKTIYSKPFVIVFSRNEDPKSVQKALNMGALFVASKQNVAHLILELYKVLPLVCKKEDKNKDYSLGHNWSLLYQLPLNKILSLKSESENIRGESYIPYEQDKNNYGFDNEKLKTDKEYLWINKLPKAELHCHIGSVLGPDLIPKTALLVLSQKYAEEKNYKNIGRIIDFILPIVSDPFLFEEVPASHSFNIKKICENYRETEWYKFKQLIIVDKEEQSIHQSVFSIIEESLNLKDNLRPEEILLSPSANNTDYLQLISKDEVYYKNKLSLNKLNVSYDEVMLFFILTLSIRQEFLQKNKKFNNFEEVLEELKSKIYKIFSEADDKDYSFPQNEIDDFCREFIKTLKLNNKSIAIFNSILHLKEINPERNIIHYLMSAQSSRRCLPVKNRGLYNYLRGCEYGGAPHLQSKESIFLIAHHIINNYAIPDNIRYLDLRCAIDGYNKFKLFKQPEDDKHIPVSKIIVNSLIMSFTKWQRKAIEKNKNVHVNLIITAKRHKNIKEFEENISITVDNYQHPKDEEINKIKSFFDTGTEIVSFDIAGLEKGNRVSKFKEKLEPLLEKCIPITMHAGEEDSHEAIWEAYYLAHAQRIGHALTLKDNEKLINSIREAFVNIELCPLSNYLTNNNYSFNSSAIKNKYPLKDYLTKRISVSINTDNPYVSDSNLSKEFLFAAKISGGLTKWEILKIILYSFKSITIHKSLKTKLLKEINEEIYELLLNEGE